jgi:hypothetical protein
MAHCVLIGYTVSDSEVSRTCREPFYPFVTLHGTVDSLSNIILLVQKPAVQGKEIV